MVEIAYELARIPRVGNGPEPSCRTSSGSLKWKHGGHSFACTSLEIFEYSRLNDPDQSMVKVYFPQDQSIQVHQSRVKVCPPNFPSGFYWYGGKETWTRPSTEVGVESAELPGLREGD